MSRWLKRFLVGIAVLPALAVAVTQTPSNPVYQWHTFIGGDDNESANKPAAAVDSAGNLYITGKTTHPWDGDGIPQSTTPCYYGYVTKISPTGQLLWSKFYNYSGGDFLPGVITLDQYGDIFIAGDGSAVGRGGGPHFVLEVDSNGDKIWGADFGSADYYGSAVWAIAYDATHDFVYITGTHAGGWERPGGGQILPGHTLPTNGSNAMFVLQAQGGPNGTLGWVGFYYTPPGGGNTYGHAIAFDGASNALYIAGGDGDKVAVWKISTAQSTLGDQVWEGIFSPVSGRDGSGALALYGSNVYVTGSADVGFNGPSGQPPLNDLYSWNGNSTPNTFVLKLDTDGNHAWHTFYHSDGWVSGPAIGYGIAVDGPSRVYVTGPGAVLGYNNAPPACNCNNGTNGHFILLLNDSGAYQWHSIYGSGSKWDEADSVAVDPQHNALVAGWSGYGGWNGDDNTLPLHPSSGAPSAIFVMKFGPEAATTTTASSVAPLAYSPGVQGITLSAAVTSTSPVDSGTVSFTSLGTTVTAGVVNGLASTGFTVPGGTAPGSYPIQASYNPGAGFAASGDNSQQLAISKSTPVVTWANPADIPYGTALGATQLNATANVPGSFLYNPPAGTILPVGNGQTLAAAFTPADSVDYNSASKTVAINVKPTPAQLVVTKTLGRDTGTHEIVVSVTVTNTGGTLAQNVQLTLGKIGAQATTTTLPRSLGNLGAGAAASAVLRFPASTGNSGAAAVLSIGGTYTGGSFSSATRITLP